MEGNNNFVKHKNEGMNSNMHIDESTKNLIIQHKLCHELKEQGRWKDAENKADALNLPRIQFNKQHC